METSRDPASRRLSSDVCGAHKEIQAWEAIKARAGRAVSTSLAAGAVAARRWRALASSIKRGLTAGE